MSLSACPIPALLLLAGLPAAAGESSELGDLRQLERQVVEAIQRARQAFVFLQGGSGFLINDGYVLTNEHVVAGQSEVVAELTEGRSFTASVAGHDPEGDVALLKLKGEPRVQPLELGDSDALKVGQLVIALGDPFLIASRNLFLEGAPPNYEPSASLGIVSALHRFSDVYNDAIQVDVAINRGNSGGPLLTLDGKVVGINGKIETRFETGINTGVGYAVPANQIQRFLEPLKRAGGGVVRHGSIHGLSLAERANGGVGLPVLEVKAGSPAEAAGFRKGDHIAAVGGLPVVSRNRYQGILGTYPVGTEVGVKVARGSETLELRASLIEPGRTPFLGMRTELQEGPEGGVSVIEVFSGSPADRAGVKVKDRVILFDGKKVESPTDLKQLIQGRSAGDEVALVLLREGGTMEIKARLGGRSER